MRQSQLFTKTRREAPADEVSKNAELLIRAGFIQKEMAGVYDYLPLGLRVLKKIENVIREEMNEIGGQEVLMTTLQDPELWKKSGRWDDSVVDNWFKTQLVTGTEIGIANTHEEPVTQMLTNFVKSYKDVPLYVYQFQTKFRNELRAKSGIMRAREFLMKDMYSFSRTEEEFKEFYEKCAQSYERVFERVGLGDITFRTIAAGGSFTTGLTDEFQTLSKAGEDTIYIDKGKKLAINKEVYTDENIAKFGLDKNSLEEGKSIEVGNIFPLGSKYSDALGLKIKDENGVEQSVIMGCYGIGLGRVMGTIAEVFADDKGLVWPKEVAPFAVHLVRLGDSDEVTTFADDMYAKLRKSSVETLYDDRDLRAGEKFADSDLIGIPVRLVVSEKTIKEGKVEMKYRTESESQLVTIEEVLKM
ncbi:MAG: aminoacyl--tRNA ligase-related protein [bacterium]